MLGLISTGCSIKDQGERENGFGETNQEATAEVQLRYNGVVESTDSKIREVLRNIQELESWDFGSLDVWRVRLKGYM